MTVNPIILDEYESILLAALGSIAAHKVVASKDSTKVIRDCSKQLDGMSVDLRRQLIELDKSLVAKHA